MSNLWLAKTRVGRWAKRIIHRTYRITSIVVLNWCSSAICSVNNSANSKHKLWLQGCPSKAYGSRSTFIRCSAGGLIQNPDWSRHQGVRFHQVCIHVLSANWSALAYLCQMWPELLLIDRHSGCKILTQRWPTNLRRFIQKLHSFWSPNWRLPWLQRICHDMPSVSDVFPIRDDHHVVVPPVAQRFSTKLREIGANSKI